MQLWLVFPFVNFGGRQIVGEELVVEFIDVIVACRLLVDAVGPALRAVDHVFVGVARKRMCLQRFPILLRRLSSRSTLLLLINIVTLHGRLLVVLQVVDDLQRLSACLFLLHLQQLLLLLLQLLHSFELCVDLIGVLLFIRILDFDVVHLLLQVVRSRLQLL